MPISAARRFAKFQGEPIAKLLTAGDRGGLHTLPGGDGKLRGVVQLRFKLRAEGKLIGDRSGNQHIVAGNLGLRSGTDDVNGISMS